VKQYINIIKGREQMTSNEYIALLNQDFNALSGDDPNRKLIFLMNSQGLSDIIGKTGYEILRYVGYDEKYICGLVQKNCQFKLAVFSQSEEIKSANWENIIELACQVYPKVSDKLRDRRRDATKYKTIFILYSLLPRTISR